MDRVPEINDINVHNTVLAPRCGEARGREPLSLSYRAYGECNVRHTLTHNPNCSALRLHKRIAVSIHRLMMTNTCAQICQTIHGICNICRVVFFGVEETELNTTQSSLGGTRSRGGVGASVASLTN